MPATTSLTDRIDGVFKSIFKFLVGTSAALVFSKAVIKNSNQWLFIAALILSTAVCVQLRLRRWSECITAVVITCLILPPLLIYVWHHIDSISLSLVFLFLSVSAYLIREHRAGSKPESKPHGAAERTPVYPPEPKES
jgi:hypothetical protein